MVSLHCSNARRNPDTLLVVQEVVSLHLFNASCKNIVLLTDFNIKKKENFVLHFKLCGKTLKGSETISRAGCVINQSIDRNLILHSTVHSSLSPICLYRVRMTFE